eukprot:scaffold120_cov176-Alexandrium_tamarense.AAC.2
MPQTSPRKRVIEMMNRHVQRRKSLLAMMMLLDSDSSSSRSDDDFDDSSSSKSARDAVILWQHSTHRKKRNWSLPRRADAPSAWGIES